MNYFRIKLGMDSGDQNSIMECCKSSGFPVIQTSDGLCVASPKNAGEVKSMLQEKCSNVNLEPVSSASPDLSPDIQAFLAENP